MPMAKSLDQQIGDRLARWVAWNARHSIAVIVLFGLGTSLLAGYTVERLGINTDTTDMLSERLQWRQDFKDFSNAFPGRFETILIVIDGTRAGRRAQNAAAQTARTDLDRKRRPIFKKFSSRAPANFSIPMACFFSTPTELQGFADRLTAVQPLLRRLSADFGIGRFHRNR